jgi:hypothetical protein
MEFTLPAWTKPYLNGQRVGHAQALMAYANYYCVDGEADDNPLEIEERIDLHRPPMVSYASRTGTRRNLAEMREAGWRLLVSAAGVLRTEGMLYAIDNGAWSAFQQGRPFDEDAFMRAVVKLISLYRSVVAVAQDLDGDHSIHDSLHANPQRLRARFAVALAPEESAQRRDHPYHLVERRWFFRTRLLTEHVGAVYLVRLEEQRRVQLRTGSAHTHEPRDTPRHDHVQHERLFHPLHL